MPKYYVERWETVVRYYHKVIEADHPDDAKEEMWDGIFNGFITPLSEKQQDCDTSVREVK